MDQAHKYKQYDRLRRPSSKQPALHNITPSKKRSTIDSYPGPSSYSPHKRPKHAQLTQASAVCSHDPLFPTQLSPMPHRTSIGPTPQKDGQVLGLFDQLSTASNSQTPSKRNVLSSVGSNMLATPSKRPQSKGRKDTDELHHKSPQSGTKSQLFNDHPTPSTSRTTDCFTPVAQRGVSKIRFDETPAFLRRDSQRADVGNENVLGDNEGVSWSPVAIRKLPKAAGRGLSALVKGLREMEDEVLDEELDVLREMESESNPRNQLDKSRVLVKDSQRPDMPLGPDGGIESDEDGLISADEGKGRDGKPLKVWKKKGQKRTTRRVLMKPNTAKWKPEPAWKVGQANGDEEDGVADSQTVSADQSTEWKVHGSDGDEYEDVECIQGVAEAETDKRDASDKDLKKKEGLAKKLKKISATAHANFRALKIKNKQSKGKKNGRFGRKR